MEHVSSADSCSLHDMPISAVTFESVVAGASGIALAVAAAGRLSFDPQFLARVPLEMFDSFHSSSLSACSLDARLWKKSFELVNGQGIGVVETNLRMGLLALASTGMLSYDRHRNLSLGVCSICPGTQPLAHCVSPVLYHSPPVHWTVRMRPYLPA